MTREEILIQIDTSRANLSGAIAGIPAGRLAESGACGHWSAKDVLGHVAFWDRFSAAQEERQLAGEPEGGNDCPGLDDRDHAAKADRDAARILAELEAARAAVFTACRALPSLVPEPVKEDRERHDEHAVEIRARRERAGVRVRLRT